MTDARTLEDYHAEPRLREVRLAAQRQANVAEIKRYQERAGLREEELRQKREARSEQLRQLYEVDCSRRLSVLATDASLPLEVIPSGLIVECISAASSLDTETKQALIRRIDREKTSRGRIWKRLRAVLSGS
jgi:hypothetical protein